MFKPKDCKMNDERRVSKFLHHEKLNYTYIMAVIF